MRLESLRFTGSLSDSRGWNWDSNQESALGDQIAQKSFSNSSACCLSYSRAGRYRAGPKGPWKGVKSWRTGPEVCVDNSFSLETDGDLILEGCLEVPAIFVGESGGTTFLESLSQNYIY